MALKDLHQFFTSHPLSRDEPFAAWKRFFSWQISCRLRQDISFRWLEGRRLIIRRGMTGATGNVYVGLHEFPDMMFLLHLLRDGDLFFDVGANVGSYSVLASGLCGARSWAFEPDADAAKSLWRNVLVNNLDDLVTLHEIAVGDCSNDVEFTVGLDTTNRVVVGRGTRTKVVRQRSLDELAAGREPIMMKIDVEGYEEAVIKGALAVLSNAALKAIEIETVTTWISDTLKRSGFERAYYDPFHRALTSDPVETAANHLFVKDREFVAERLASARSVDVFGRKI